MDLRRFDLNLLVAFDALAATGSVSLAAQRIGVKQPAMSAALSRLRLLTGDRLFERVGGTMLPTSRATEMIPGVAAALVQVRTALSGQIAFDPATSTRSFALAVTDYTGAMLLPPLMNRLREQSPGIDLRAIAYEKQDIPDLVARGEIDAAIGVFDPLPAEAVCTPLWTERFVGLARTDHPLLDDLTVEAFAAAQHALVSVRRDARGRIDTCLEALGLRRRIALVLPHMLALPPVLLASDLIAALPERIARRYSGDGLTSFELPVDSAQWQVEMLWSPSSRADQAGRWLRSQLVEASRRIDDSC